MLTEERRPNTTRAACPLTRPRTAEKRERTMDVHRVNLEGGRQGGKEGGKRKGGREGGKEDEWESDGHFDNLLSSLT